MEWSVAFLRAAICGLAFLCVVSLASAADNDKAKPAFKVGDTVEVKDGESWVRGTIIDLSFGDRIRVKTERYKNGWPFAADEVRPLAKKKKPPAVAKNDDSKPAAAPKGDESKPSATTKGDESNPFATPEEKAESIGKRAWSDKSGKFKIEATIVRFEGDKVILKRTDGKEVTVPIERLSPQDQQIIAKAGGPTIDAADDDDDASDAPSTGKASKEPEVTLMATNVFDATAVDISHTDDWSYKPDVAKERKLLRLGRMALGQRLASGESPTRLLLSPTKGTAFVVFKPMDGKDGFKPGPRIVACDVARHKVLAAGEFHSEQLPLDLSDDGSLLLARESKQPFNKGTTIFLYAMDGNKAKPKLSWQPYADGKETKEFSWASFVDDQHVLTMSDQGLLVLWDITSEPKPLWRATSDIFGGSSVAFSANRRYIALCEKTGVAILDPQSGQVAGHLAMGDFFHHPALAFSDDGRKLAVATGARVRVWDLDQRKLDRDFAANGARFDGGLSWADDDRLISARGDLIDVERRIVLWRYSGVGDASQLLGDTLWTVMDSGRDNQTLIGARVPHEAAKSRAKSIKPSDILLIQPGMEVAIEMQFVGTPQDQEAVQQALEKRLTDNGMKVVLQSPLKLVAQIKPGKAAQIAYRPFGSRTASQHTAMSQVMELSYVRDGQPLWTHKGESSPPRMLHMQRGQTIDQALSEHMRVDPKALGSVYIPSHITKAQNDPQNWTSPLPGA